MPFNSVAFAVFFAITYALYVIARHRQQNVVLLVASYVFYGYWDWRFLGLIGLSTLVDYGCGLAIHHRREHASRRRFLLISVGANLALLGFFKYYDFFASSLQDLGASFGWQVDPFTLNVILPVGISFYTFQTMSYTIDIYRGQLRPTRNLLDFAVFVAFFPQLVAGPIERASNLLPQVERRRHVTEAQFHRGAWLIFFGLFKKVFIADNLAPIVDRAFASGADLSGAEVLVAVYAFAFQIYGDFSGYSDIARGLSHLMGFDLMLNFRMPYFARNPREFWQRWHISLSTWLRDYLYISLGGSRRGTSRTYVNLVLTMLLGGLWHGAAWTFVVWGLFHGMLLTAHRAMAPGLVHIRGLFGRQELAWRLLSMATMFHFTCIGWLMFRADTVGQIDAHLRSIVFDFGSPRLALGDVERITFYMAPLMAIQVLKEVTGDMDALQNRVDWRIRGVVYFIMAVLLVTAGAAGGRAFIYFQF